MSSRASHEPPARRLRALVACFGGQASVIVEGTSSGGRPVQLAALLAQAQLYDVHRRLSRFEPASELSRLNAAAAEVVPASRLLRRLARAVVQAGIRSGGLVDATCLGALERTGYAGSRAALDGLTLADIIAAAPPPRPAGVRIDGGGLAKGLAADLLAATLDDHPAFAIDCAGDVRIGGLAGIERRVLVANPFGGPPAHELQIAAGAAATSGIGRRSWRLDGGAVAHHLIDPATGRPAWTGVVQATALAPTALAAEILAKTALLRGPRHGRDALEHGGVLVLADGTVAVVEARLRQLA